MLFVSGVFVIIFSQQLTTTYNKVVDASQSIIDQGLFQRLYQYI